MIDQSNTSSTMEVRSRRSRNQNIQNNSTNRYGRSSSRIHRDFPAGVQYQPYVRNSRRQLNNSTEQQSGSRYNLRNVPSNPYGRHRNVDRNSNNVNDNNVIPVQQTDLSNTSSTRFGIPIRNIMISYRQEAIIDRMNGRIESLYVDLINRMLQSQSAVQRHVDGSEPRRDYNNNCLTREAVSGFLRKRSYSKDEEKEDQKSQICIVCQKEFEEDEILGCLGCGHEYHADCITTWLLHKNLCPLCKATAI